MKVECRPVQAYALLILCCGPELRGFFPLQGSARSQSSCDIMHILSFSSKSTDISYSPSISFIHSWAPWLFSLAATCV